MALGLKDCGTRSSLGRVVMEMVRMEVLDMDVALGYYAPRTTN